MNTSCFILLLIYLIERKKMFFNYNYIILKNNFYLNYLNESISPKES
jgi:hypothetical protein